MNRITSILSTTRFIRGVIQGFFLVSLLRDLHHLGGSALMLGEALSAGLTADFLMTLLLGHLSDRRSPRTLLLVGEVAGILPAFLFLLHPSAWLLGFSILTAGLGQRTNGSPGPYAPAEQILLVRESSPSSLFFRLSRNTSAGLAGMAAGAFLGGYAHASSNLGDLRAPMLAFLLLSGINILLLLTARIIPFPPHEQKKTEIRSPFSRSELHNLSLMIFSNLFGGLAIGLVDPVVAFWLHLKFHADLKETGLLLATTYLASAFLSLYIATRNPSGGLLRSVIQIQILSFAALLCLPFVSMIGPALALYTLRFAGLRAQGGVRQAMAGLVVNHRKTGWASALHLSSLSFGQIAGPVIAGALWQKNLINGPIYLSAISMGISLILFGILFPRKDEQSSVMTKQNPVI